MLIVYNANLSNHSFDYEPYPLGHFKEIFPMIYTNPYVKNIQMYQIENF